MKRNKGPRKNWFKIQVSIKMFGYSVNFAVPPPPTKKGGANEFYRNVILLPRFYLAKILAHCDDW